MDRRKIQLVAGTTYSISLPKEWVKKNKLKERDEVIFDERADRTLVLSPYSLQKKDLKEITLNIDELTTNIDQILLAVYYQGIEKIQLVSNKEITKDVKAIIRVSLNNMSGTEISYEDKKKMIVRVLLDKGKVDVIQTLYRIFLLIESSITNIVSDFDIREIRINESEIDRLFHLIVKIISLSLTDSQVLYSSNIKNVSLIPSYFLMSKRLENIADRIHSIGKILDKNPSLKIENRGEIFKSLKFELNRTIDHIIKKKQATVFEKMELSKITTIEKGMEKVRDKNVHNNLIRILRFVIDIQEELVIFSFYNQLSQKNTV